MINNKKGQITIFIIIAIVIVAALIIFFTVRNVLDDDITRSEFSPIYESFDSCIEQTTREALSIAGTQAGYLFPPDFEPGSEYAPFSNQLEFVGLGIPYWYYLSSNGLVKEQVPNKRQIENQIAEFLEFELTRCDFSSFRQQGHEININTPDVEVKILDNKVQVKVDMNLEVEKVGSSEVKSSHEVEVRSKFGEFYNIALELYDKELQEVFLEDLSVDVMYNYAPVTGSEVSCSPLIWNPSEVVNDIKSGLSSNVQALKVDNGNYDLQNEEDKYFVVDFQTDENVRFLYQEDWPSKVEIWPAENNLLLAEPVGLEEGLGILGFCYVPYHFVYDIYYPVLIQIYDTQEIFQFPVSVIVDKSVPRNSLEGERINEESSLNEFCSYRNTEVEVFTFDSALEPVEADIYFTCLNERCNMGKTQNLGSDAVLIENFPQCINGLVEAKAEGYITGSVIKSTNSEGVANIVLDKLYDLDLELVVGGLPLESRDAKGLAVVNFKNERYTTTVVYPRIKDVKLAEGLYNVSVQVFSGSSLTIPSSSERQCIEVASPGLLGFFGKKNEECFNIELPAQTLDNALSGGGNSQEFIFESDLQSSNSVKVSVPLLPNPTTFDQLQQNYELLSSQRLGVELS